MPETWLQRLKNWMCRTFGHVRGATWVFNGVNATCKRCRMTYKVKEKDEAVSDNKE